MLTTSEPLQSPDECDLVSGFLELMANAAYDPDAEFQGNIEDIQKGADALERVRDQIDELTGCPTHAGEYPLPQYVVYEPKDPPADDCGVPTREELLTYGLHVDTNKGENCRHLTCLVYLNSNDKGATTFPLAKPYDGRYSKAMPDQMKHLRNGAKRLILSDVQHTAAEEIRYLDIVDDLEQAAFDLYTGASKQTLNA